MSGAVVAASIAIYFLTGQIAVITKKIVADRSLIDQQTGSLAVLASLKNDAPEAAKYQAVMEKLLPTQDGLVSFGQWLDGIARADHLSINFAFQNSTVPSTESTAGTVGFTLEADGSLDTIGLFLKDIESRASGFLLQINSVTLVKNDHDYRMNAQGSVFFK